MDIKNVSNLYTLLLLSEGPKHGYEISKYIEEKTGKKLSPGQIYPFFQKLLENNYIKVSELGDRDRKKYELTSEGKKFVHEQLEKLSGMIELAMEPNIKECATCSCRIVDNYYEEDGKIYCCKSCAGHNH